MKFQIGDSVRVTFNRDTVLLGFVHNIPEILYEGEPQYRISVRVNDMYIHLLPVPEHMLSFNKVPHEI